MKMMLTGSVGQPETVGPRVSVEGVEGGDGGAHGRGRVFVVLEGEPEDADQVDEVGDGQRRQIRVGGGAHPAPGQHHHRHHVAEQADGPDDGQQHLHRRKRGKRQITA